MSKKLEKPAEMGYVRTKIPGFYRAGTIRTRAVEVAKMRGVAHSSVIVPLKITKHGLEVSPRGYGADIIARKAELAEALSPRVA